jgi:hypothetical protein
VYFNFSDKKQDLISIRIIFERTIQLGDFERFKAKIHHEVGICAKRIFAFSEAYGLSTEKLKDFDQVKTLYL